MQLVIALDFISCFDVPLAKSALVIVSLVLQVVD